MSLDYYSYVAAKRPFTPNRIAAASSWQFLFVDPDQAMTLHSGRSLPSYSLVFGCRRKARLDLHALHRAGSLTGGQSVAGVGCCGLEIECDFEADEELLGELPPRYRRLMAEAATRYETRTSAGRNDESWELQRALCLAIAKAVGGLMENPQIGRFRAIKASGLAGA